MNDLFNNPIVAPAPFRKPVLNDMGGYAGCDPNKFEQRPLSGFGLSRIIKPKGYFHVPTKFIKARYAQDLVKDLGDIEPGFMADVILSGAFYFSDFISLFIKENDFHVSKLSISTLSLNPACVDLFAELMNDGWVDEMNIIVGAKFYNDFPDTMAYLYDKLDINNSVQIAVASSHIKDVLIEIPSGDDDYENTYITISGSANSRSSQCNEHIIIREGKEVYEWNLGVVDNIISEFATINKDVELEKDVKALRNKPLWAAVTK